MKSRCPLKYTILGFDCVKTFIKNSPVLSLRGTFTSVMYFFPKGIICSESVCIFPFGCFVFTLLYSNAGQSTRPCRGFLMFFTSLPHSCWSHFTLQQSAVHKGTKILSSGLLVPVARQNISRLLVLVVGLLVFSLQMNCSRVSNGINLIPPLGDLVVSKRF